jgi:hypothetical protein
MIEDSATGRLRVLRQSPHPGATAQILGLEEAQRRRMLARNEPCPCDSGQKFKTPLRPTSRQGLMKGAVPEILVD